MDNMMEYGTNWQTSLLYKGRYLELGCHTFERSGQQHKWEFVKRSGAGGAAGFFGLYQGALVLIRQFRPALQKMTVELPAGLLDVEGESAEDAIGREMIEETGYPIKSCHFLERMYSSPGMTSEYIDIFYGDLDEPGEPQPDGLEEIHVYPPVGLDELAGFLQQEQGRGYVVDFKIWAAMALYQTRLSDGIS
jgi:ADP-ribose pyrophosphatase